MKLLVKIVAGFVALLLVAVVALVLFFDPNVFKPRIEAMAKEQGIALNIDGDLGWKLWPSFGVEVNEIRVAAISAPNQPIAKLKQASLLLAIKPLFNGNLIVHHVLVDGAVIDLKVNEQGTGNWEALTTAKDATTTETQTTPATTTDVTPADTGNKMQLAVEEISLHNSSLSYSDAQSGQNISLEDIQLDLRKFNLQGQPFVMQLALITRISNSAQQAGEELAVETSFNHQIQITEDFSAVQLTDGQLKVVIKANQQSGELSGLYSVSISDLHDALSFNGQVDITSFNAKKILAALGTEPVASQSYALTDIALKTSFSGTAKNIVFDPLQIKLDKTTINGSIAVTDFATSAIKVLLSGDEINVDHYLAPEDETVAAQAPAATGDEELIPLETVKAFNADISASFTQVTVANIPLKNITLRTTAKDGLVNLSKAQATAYEGVIDATGSLDGRGNTALIKFDGKVDRVQLEPFFKDMEFTDKINLTGAINATATGNTRGVTMNQLMDALISEANFSGAQVRLSPLNIEQKFCQLVNLVNRAEAPQQEWPEYTEMRDLSGKATIAKQVITLESFNAGVNQLMLGVKGTLNLATDEFDFRLPLQLVSAAAKAPGATTATSETASGAISTPGCGAISGYWLNRSISLLRCQGSLETLNPVKDCRPDSKALTSLTKDFAEFKLREKHGDKIDAAEKKVDEKKDELRQKLDEKIGVPTEGQKPRDILKSLINKKTGKKPEPAPEDAPAPTPAPTSAPEATEPEPEGSTEAP